MNRQKADYFEFLENKSNYRWCNLMLRVVAAAYQKTSAQRRSSAAEAVEGSSLSLEGVDDVEGGDGLSLGMFGVGDGVSDDVLEEASEDVSGLLVDEGADSLDTTSSGESSDGGLGDAHDGLLERFLDVSLGSDFTVTLSNFTSSGHCVIDECSFEIIIN